MQYYMDMAAMRKRVTDYTKPRKENPVKYHGDGPSYDATTKSRNLTGFAPDKWQECPKTPMPQSQTLPELNERFDNLSAAADQGRQYDSPAAAYKPVHGGYLNEDLSGRVHPEAVVMDRTGKITREIFGDRRAHPIYFDAVKLAQALGRIAHDWQEKTWSLETILRHYRLADTDTERTTIAMWLIDVYNALNTKEVQATLEIEAKVHTIEGYERLNEEHVTALRQSVT